jgi:hypothetical protein
MPLVQECRLLTYYVTDLVHGHIFSFSCQLTIKIDEIELLVHNEPLAQGLRSYLQSLYLHPLVSTIISTETGQSLCKLTFTTFHPSVDFRVVNAVMSRPHDV